MGNLGATVVIPGPWNKLIESAGELARSIALGVNCLRLATSS